MFFFFSSRRRHTRYIGDWSSDVCSSDLAGNVRGSAEPSGRDFGGDLGASAEAGESGYPGELLRTGRALEIGRASCRERVWIGVEGGVVGKKKAQERRQRESDTRDEGEKR